MAYTIQVWSYRGLIGHLAQRELKSKYKRSVLGWLWSLLNPAATLLIYTMVFGTVLRIPPPVAGNGTLVNFALFLFSALVIWNFFNGVVVGSMGSLISAGSLLKKVYFPPECPVIANVLTVLLQTGLEALILVTVLIVLGNVSWTFLLFPYLLLLLGMFSLGIGLVLSLANVYLRDVNYLVGIGMSLLFYGTPIVYTYSLVEENAPEWIQTMVQLNPLTHFVTASQQIFYLLEVPDLSRIVGLTVTSVLTFVLGSLVFLAKSGDVSEEL